MRIFLTNLIFLLPILMLPVNAYSWGKQGHQITAEIANRYLSDKARINLQECLGSISITEAATWMDEIRNNHSLDYMKPWHYINIEKGQKYDPTSSNNIIWALNKVYSELQHWDQLTREQAKIDVMIFIHLMGDIQQPLHVGYGSDKGGNTMQVQFNGKGTNLHHLWDSDLIENQQITITSVLSARKYVGPDLALMMQLKVKPSDFLQYMDENRMMLPDIYNFKGHTVDQAYAARMKSKVEAQLFNGGFRLAVALDGLFRNNMSYKNETGNTVKSWPIPKTIAKQTGIITAEEAVNHIGEQVTVCGRVYGAKYLDRGKNGPTFINMGAPYPNSPFTVVIFKNDRIAFSYAPESFLDGKDICVTGEIKDYKGQAEIIVNNEMQIRVQ